MAGVIKLTKSNHNDLTPEERQAILRRLKRGPVTTREALVEYANKVRQDVLSKRKASQ